MPLARPFIVGRRDEVRRFDTLLSDHTSSWLLNVYGLGGIGKTVVHSNGQTEGFINKLKLTKRSMYGRGQIDLLRQRVLHEV